MLQTEISQHVGRIRFRTDVLRRDLSQSRAAVRRRAALSHADRRGRRAAETLLFDLDLEEVRYQRLPDTIVISSRR